MSNYPNELFVSWQNPVSRAWYVVGKVTEQENLYQFEYVQGAKKAQKDGFLYFDSMSDLNTIYQSEDLFPFLKNRLLSPRRPEYSAFIGWLGLSDNVSNIEILARSNGTKVTDNIQTFKPVEFDENNQFNCDFFVHGTQYDGRSEHIATLKVGDELKLMREPDNPFDNYAVLVCDGVSENHLGYCPRYLSKTISIILDNRYEYYTLKVVQVEENAPKNYRLRCKLEGKLKSDIDKHKLFDGDYQPIVVLNNLV